MAKYDKEALKKVLANLEEGEKVLKQKTTTNFTYLPRGSHVVRLLPDAEPKLFAAARVHTLKSIRTIEKQDKKTGDTVFEEVERTTTILCGRGPDGTGYCPICEYASEVWEKEGRDSGISWIFARPLTKFTFYVHETDASVEFRGKEQWKPGMIVVTAVSSKNIANQIITLIRRISKNPDSLYKLLNYTEEPFNAMTIIYPGGKDTNPQVSWEVGEDIPPLDEGSLPEWLTDENFDMAKVGIDFTRQPTKEELEEALEGYIRWRNRTKDEGDQEELKKKIKKVVKEEVPEEPAKEEETAGTEEDTPPWEDDIERTPAKSANDPKPKCFGNYVASDECTSCAYMAECIEALGEKVEAS